MFRALGLRGLKGPVRQKPMRFGPPGAKNTLILGRCLPKDAREARGLIRAKRAPHGREAKRPDPTDGREARANLMSPSISHSVP